MKKTNITNETRKAVYRRDGYQCAVCGDPRRLQIHHITHRSQGGGDEQMNLVTLCPICHAIAHNTKFPALPEEYGPDDVEQAIVEYMSDLYADLGFTWPDGQPIGGVGEWNPWGTDRLEESAALGLSMSFEEMTKFLGEGEGE